jgi:hypothetical protein
MLDQQFVPVKIIVNVLHQICCWPNYIFLHIAEPPTKIRNLFFVHTINS